MTSCSLVDRNLLQTTQFYIPEDCHLNNDVRIGRKLSKPESMVEGPGTFVGGQNGPGRPNFDIDFYRKHSI